MGFIEDIRARTDIGDDVKEAIITSHRGEVDPLRAQSRKEKVEGEITALSNLGFSEAPGLLKYVRRVFLSDDEQPGVVLMSDTDMGLTGDLATGATGREEQTVAGAIRKFIELMPKSEEGKLSVNLSDQASTTDDHGRPDNGDGTQTEEEKAANHNARTARLSGRKIDRAEVRNKRYARTISGGD